jgi:hypothetical protein
MQISKQTQDPVKLYMSAIGYWARSQPKKAQLLLHKGLGLDKSHYSLTAVCSKATPAGKRNFLEEWETFSLSSAKAPLALLGVREGRSTFLGERPNLVTGAYPARDRE